MPQPLADQVPEFDPAQETVSVAGIAALELFPVVGGALASIVGGALATQAQRRNIELFQMIAEVVDELSEQVEGLTMEAIVSDPRFLATAEKVVRAAQQSADDEHRARLLRALCHAGAWSEQEPYAAGRMTDLLTRLGPIHIFVTRFFADPAAWLRDNGGEAWSNGQETINGGTLIGVFGRYVFPNNGVPPSELARVVEELQRESIIGETRANSPSLFNSQMTGQGLIEPRLTDFGRAFLAFAEEDLAP